MLGVTKNSEKEGLPQPIRINNSLRLLKGIKDLPKVELDLDSPLFKNACKNLGVLPQECILK